MSSNLITKVETYMIINKYTWLHKLLRVFLYGSLTTYTTTPWVKKSLRDLKQFLTEQRGILYLQSNVSEKMPRQRRNT